MYYFNELLMAQQCLKIAIVIHLKNYFGFVDFMANYFNLIKIDWLSRYRKWMKIRLLLSTLMSVINRHTRLFFSNPPYLLNFFSICVSVSFCMFVPYPFIQACPFIKDLGVICTWERACIQRRANEIIPN